MIDREPRHCENPRHLSREHVIGLEEIILGGDIAARFDLLADRFERVGEFHPYRPELWPQPDGYTRNRRRRLMQRRHARTSLRGCTAPGAPQCGRVVLT